MADGAYGGFTYNGNGTLAGGAPTPTPGIAVGDEKELAGNAQWPAPIVYATVGDVVQIRFKNLGVVANPRRRTTRTASTCTGST